MGIVGGWVTTLVGGSKAQPPDSRGSPDRGPACAICLEDGEHAHSVRQKIFAMCRYAFGEFLDDISPQLVVGLAISGVISFLVPPDFFGHYVDNEFAAMLLMIVGGIPLYVCATASIPIAAALMMKGLSPGAAFVFLAVGPATNAATITLIAAAMGRKTVAVYLSVIAVLSIVAGLALNGVFSLLGTGAGPVLQMRHHHETGASPFALTIAALFALLLALSLARRILPQLRTSAFPGKQAASSADFEVPIAGKPFGKP